MNRYQNVNVIQNSKGVKYYKDIKYPRVPLTNSDIYVITVSGDRLDLLANQYYKDPSLWWVISIANEFLPQGSLYLTPGIQLRIPGNPSNLVTEFVTSNNATNDRLI